MKSIPSKSTIARAEHSAGPAALTHHAQEPPWLSQRSFQHLARLATATIPCAAAAQRELERQLCRFEEEIFVKAMDLGATRRQAFGLARRLTGRNRAVRTSMLLSGEIDRARAAIDVLVDSLFSGTTTGAAGARQARKRRDNSPATRYDGADISYLAWNDAYGCGQPTIDDEHHELFSLGNNLIDASLAHRPSTFRVASALGRLLEHVTQHFADEEAWLAARCYGGLQAHKAAHAALLFRATQLRAKFDLATPNIGEFVSFLAHDVVAKHMLAADRDYYSLVAYDRGVSGARTSLT